MQSAAYQVWDQVSDQVEVQVWNRVRDQVGAQIWGQVRKDLDLETEKSD